MRSKNWGRYRENKILYKNQLQQYLKVFRQKKV